MSPSGESSIDAALLERLLAATGPMTLEALGRALDCAPMEAARRVETLRQAGCRIDAHPQQGMTLIETGLGCWADYLQARHAGRLGRRIVVYRSTTSTQDRARQELARADSPQAAHGTVVLADEQTAGRGRLGRSWLTRAGGALLMTVVVDAGETAADRLVLASACAVAQAVEQLVGLHARLRWPNDVLLGEAKLAGTLLETAERCALIGVGINVSDCPDLPDHPATCLAERSAAVDRLRLADVLLDQLDRALFDEDDDELHEQWRQRSSLLQRRVTVTSGDRTLTGRVLDVDVEHGLMLAVEDGPHIVLPAATTSLMRMH